MTKKTVVTRNELKALLERIGVEYKPTYKHEDYMFTSFTMPYPLKHKLDRLCKRFGVSRSGFVQLLIDNVKE